ncbi:MAG TPA: type II and III secretion system protein [Thermoanaerobaculia bacterium]
MGHRFGTAVLLLLMLCQGGQVSAEPLPTAFILETPIRSTATIEKLLDEAVLELVTAMDYREGADPRFQWRSSLLQRVEAARYLSRSSSAGHPMTIELYAVRNPAGDFVIRGEGLTLTGNDRLPNADLNRAEMNLQQWSQRLQTAPVPAGGPVARDIATRTVQLSHVQTDRVLAVLKALGYSVIEYMAQKGESPFDTLFSPNAPMDRLPVVIKMVDAAKTSLMDPKPESGTGAFGAAMPPPQPGFGVARQPIPDIGGTFLHNVTSSDPPQRLLIAWDRSDPDSLERLMTVIERDIDLPGRQVVISALVVEVNQGRLRDLGITFSGTDGRTSVGFERNQDGTQRPFTFSFDEGAFRGDFNFSATLSALIERGEAEILSNPSVLVVDGRQARIQIGQQVPVVSSTSTAAGITSSVEYFPVGIVLNIRPRINQDGSEVAMQVETIVSAVAQTSVAVSQVFFAPTIDNRQVQTFVRVADNTPFIIGGLISSDRQSDRSGIPGLSRVPLIGSLFRRSVTSNFKREVIVVLTPHVVPLEERAFSYVVPQDADRFDSAGHQLFRNSYRVRRGDVFDLSFIYESEAFRSLVRSGRAEASGRNRVAPGEDVLVRRMLWELSKNSGLGKSIDPKQMLFFRETEPGEAGEVSFLETYLSQLDSNRNALVLTFPLQQRGDSEHPFVASSANLSFESIRPDQYERRLRELNRRDADGNPLQWGIILSEADPSSTSSIDALRAALVLKQILSLNSSLPLQVKEFYVGRQITMPASDDVSRNVQVIDASVARLFYEAKDYYRAFEKEFNAQLRAAPPPRP